MLLVKFLKTAQTSHTSSLLTWQNIDVLSSRGI